MRLQHQLPYRLGNKVQNKVLNETVEENLKQILYDIAEEQGFMIQHLEIGLDDHVHMMISAPPKLSVTTIVSCLKGTSAFRLFRLHPELKRFYWKISDRHLWSPSYFAETIGEERKRNMKKNILSGKMIRLYPNKMQTEMMLQFFGSARWLWNQMLDMQQQRYANGGKHISRNGMNYVLTELKNEYPWLKDAESTSLINVNAKLDETYKRYFHGLCRKPRFKAKKYEQSITVNCVNSNIQILDDHHIRIPKLGYVYYRGGKNIKEKIKSVTLRLSASEKFTASVLTECTADDLPATGKTCGGDLGLKELLILDDGTKVPMSRWDKKSEEQLHYWQRLASRRLLKAKEAMKADSSLHLSDFKNYQKARRMCAKIQEHIANQRQDYLHKLSIWLIKTYDVIVIEDLKVKGMLHNHKLARAISNAGWNKLIEMLRYKCEWYGKQLVQVDPAYTSQTCSTCGCVNNRLGYDHYGWLKVREWECQDCGTVHDRDINAAVNIKEKGLAISLS